MEYPYGRKGDPICYSESTVDREQLEQSAETGDNQLSEDGNIIHLYEAPCSVDTGRGYYSKWAPSNSDSTYRRVEAFSGDDGDIFETFKQNA